MQIVSDQRGNIFFYILLAVVLIAALSLAIASSMRGNSGISNERINLVASEVIESGSRLAETVARLRLRGIASTAISFENSTVTGYANAACTTDPCKIFEATGGGLSWEESPPSSGNNQPWGYTADMNITQVGTTESDLIAILPEMTLEACQSLNAHLDIAAPTAVPPVQATLNSINKFTGTFAVTPVTLTPTILSGRKSGCFQATAASGTALSSSGGPLASKYYYYQVLIAR